MVIPTFRYLLILAVIVASGVRTSHAQSAERSDLHRDRDQAARRASKAQSEFDAVTLQSLIAPMFSGIKGGPLGSGQAGRYWQSLMTEHIARQIASSGQLRLLKVPPGAPHATRGAGIIPNNDVGRSADARLRGAPMASWETNVYPASAIEVDGSK